MPAFNTRERAVMKKATGKTPKTDNYAYYKNSCVRGTRAWSRWWPRCKWWWNRWKLGAKRLMLGTSTSTNPLHNLAYLPTTFVIFLRLWTLEACQLLLGEYHLGQWCQHFWPSDIFDLSILTSTEQREHVYGKTHSLFYRFLSFGWPHSKKAVNYVDLNP